MKNKLQFMFIFIVLGITGFVIPTIHAQGIGDRNRAGSTGTYNIQGKVYLPDGKPAVNAKVSITGADFTNISVRTDLNGEFNTGGIAAGNYNISIKVEGFPTETEVMTIDRDTPSGQTFSRAYHLRMPGQKKGEPAGNLEYKEVPPKALEKFKAAVEKITKNDAKGALPLLDEAIALYANFAAAYYEKGAAYLSLNDPDKAIEAFVKAITLKPDYLEAKYGYGKAMFEKKNYELAEAAFRDVLKQKSDFAEAHLNLGISLFYLKNGNEAESELKAALATKEGEKFALGHLYLGQIYLMKKQNADAITELQKYVELAPNAPNAEKIKSKIADLKKQP